MFRTAATLRRHLTAHPLVLSLILGAGIATLGACTEVGTSPNAAVAISFDTLPSPSVIYGDTLRDIHGVAAPLTAYAYNADGKKIAGAPIKYFVNKETKTALDSVTIDSITRFLVATRDTSVKQIQIFAQVGNIRALSPRILEVVPSPDSVDRGQGVDRTRDTLEYAATDTAGVLSVALSLRVLDRTDTAGPITVRGVRSWPVRYALVAPVRTDTLLAFVNDLGNASTLDTTGTDGVASRKLRLRRRTGLATDVPDSVIVEVTARNPQGDLKGAPIRYVLLLRKIP